MMKRVLLVLLVALGLLAGAVVLFVVSRPPAPQRDYFAEYDALIAQRFPDGRAGVDAFEALLALDRYAQVDAIAKDSVARAIERAAADGLDIDLIDVESLEVVVLHPLSEPDHWPDDPEERGMAERVLREARAEAIPRVLELLMDPAWRSAVAAFAEHDTVLMPTVPGPTLFDRLLPHLSPMRRSALADATLLRLSDDEAARLEALRSTLAMARSSASIPTIIGGLVQAAIEGLACRVVLDAVGDRAEPIADPRAWLAEFRRHEELRSDASWHFRGERIGMLDIIDAEYTKRPGAMRLNTPTTLPIVGISHGKMYATVTEHHDAMARSVAQPPGQRTDAFPDASKLRIDFRARPLLEAVLPALESSLAKYDHSDAELVGTMAALALAAYRSDHGGWPATLDDLVPEYLDAVPTDPFAAAGTPLVYRLGADGSPTLYSVGPNQQDDGGARAEDERALRERGDMVFLPRE